MEKKYAIPLGMIEAARRCEPRIGSEPIVDVLVAAVRWLAENPIVPTQKQVNDLMHEYVGPGPYVSRAQHLAAEWQRSMFLAPERQSATTADQIRQRVGRCPPSQWAMVEAIKLIAEWIEKNERT